MADRRTQPDRRRWRLRNRRERRHGDRRIFVLELTSAHLNVLELQRSGDEAQPDRLAASSVAWRQSAAMLNSPEGAAELAAAFREVARRHVMHGAEIRVVLSGEFCVLRTVRGSAEEVHRELQQLEERSRLYLSLGVGPKVLVSSASAVDARHSHAQAAVCNQATLEAIQAASEAAGIEIGVIEPALCALSRVARRLPQAPAGAYLIVNVNPWGMEVGVCHQGQLLLDYRPGGRTASANLLPLLDAHLNRLSRHVGRCLRTAAPEITDVYLCGEPSAVERAARQFQRQGAIQVHQLRPADIKATWRIDAPDASLSTAALGAMLAAYLPEADPGVPNLMQHIIECQREPLRPTIVRCALPLAATLLVAAGLWIVNARVQRELDLMQAELDSLAVAEARATELRLQLISSKCKLVQLEGLARQLPAELGDELILGIGKCMPSDVWLSQLEIADGQTARLRGASYLEAGVYDFVRWLEQAPGFSEVALKGTSPSTSATGPVTNFELELGLADESPAPLVASAPAPPSRQPPAASH